MTQQRFFTEEQRREIWQRYRSGESDGSIARSLGRYPSAIHQVIRRTGGVCPSERTRSRLALSAGDREDISRGLAAEESCREIARRIRRSPSTVSREVARNGGRPRYRAEMAERRASREARRPKPGKRARCPRLRRVVENKLEKKWSPEQISRWLAATYSEREDMREPRDHLPLALRAGTGRTAARIAPSPTHGPRHPTPEGPPSHRCGHHP